MFVTKIHVHQITNTHCSLKNVHLFHVPVYITASNFFLILKSVYYICFEMFLLMFMIYIVLKITFWI